jgi:hypothetical protein
MEHPNRAHPERIVGKLLAVRISSFTEHLIFGESRVTLVLN